MTATTTSSTRTHGRIRIPPSQVMSHHWKNVATMTAIAATVLIVAASLSTARSYHLRRSVALELRIPGELPSFHAFAFAASQIGAAEDNALGLLLEDGSFSLAPYVLARAAIEASGRAFLLLDPSLTELERTEWAVAEKLHDLRTLERLMLANDPDLGGGQVRADVADVRRRIAGLLHGARSDGLQIRRRPRFTDVLKAVLDPGNNTLGAIAAVNLSSIAHAAPEAIVATTWALDNTLGHEWGVGSAELDDTSIVDLVVSVLLPYVRAVSRQVDAFEWPPSSWTRWVSHVRSVLVRAVRGRRT